MAARPRSRSRSKARADKESPFPISTINTSCSFGAVVETPLSAQSILEDRALATSLLQAWREFGGLLVLRGLKTLTALEFEAISRIFGILEHELDDTKKKYSVDGVASVMRLGNTRDVSGNLTAVFMRDVPLPENGSCQYRSEVRKPVWHTDQTYRRTPPIGSLLYCKQAPPKGGATCFADMRSAYAQLDAATKERLAGLECICSLTHHDNKVRTWAPEYPAPTMEDRMANPAVRVPMVLVHPLTHVPALYGWNSSVCQIAPKGTRVSQEQMDKYELNGFEDPSVEHEWRSLLPFVTSPRFTVVWEWQEGDLVIWDNRCTMHSATGFDHEKFTREMWRTTLAADRELVSSECS